MTVLPTGTVTFLFTDIEGSTRRWEADVEAMRAAVAEHENLLEAAVSENGGHVVKTMGDGVLAVFGDAVSAMRASDTSQQRLTLPVRMGLHTGTAQERNGDYYGPALNRAARIMGLAHGGQILLPEATAALVRDDVDLVDLGPIGLPDITGRHRGRRRRRRERPRR